MRNSICLTFDVDWASDRLLEEVFKQLKSRGLRATFFATHDSALLRAADADIEVALHPDFVDGAEPDEVIATLQRAYPNAAGARSHRLACSSPILQAHARRGLRYESNIFLPYHPAIVPVTRFESLTSIPFYWSDDHHLMFGRPFDLAALRLETPGLKVLNFHPVHVCLNTTSEVHYSAAKGTLHDDASFDAARATEPGIRTLFDALLATLDPATTRTLSELADDYLASSFHERPD